MGAPKGPWFYNAGDIPFRPFLFHPFPLRLFPFRPHVKGDFQRLSFRPFSLSIHSIHILFLFGFYSGLREFDGYDIGNHWTKCPFRSVLWKSREGPSLGVSTTRQLRKTDSEVLCAGKWNELLTTNRLKLKKKKKDNQVSLTITHLKFRKKKKIDHEKRRTDTAAGGETTRL